MIKKCYPFPLLMLFGFIILFTSCQKDEQVEDIQVETAERSLKSATVEIFVDFDSGRCCINLWNRRKAHVIVGQRTYNLFCTSSSSLTYKFYNQNSPLSPPIVRVSNEKFPVFCLPPRLYSVLVSNSGVPELIFDTSNGSFYNPGSQGSVYSSIYELDLSEDCRLFPVPDRDPKKYHS